MRRALTPRWLASPSRFAVVSQPTARLVLALVSLVLLATLMAVSAPLGQPDTSLYAGIVEAVRHCGSYYAVAGDALRAGKYPLEPFTTFPLPTLAVVAGSLPGLAVTTMLYCLVAAVAVAWYARLTLALKTRAARTLAAVLLFAGLAPLLRTDLSNLPETWAGLLIALSLGVHRPGRWIDAVAFGLAATLICDAAVLYIVTMTGFAIRERRRDETLGWIAALGLLAIVLAFHAHAVAAIVTSLDIAVGTDAPAGTGSVVSAFASATMLDYAPLWVAGPVVGLALFGWTPWRDAIAPRVLGTILLAVLLIALLDRSGTSQSALLVSPLLLVGLVLALDGLRDLFAAALDTRRITVKRIIR
ncbi:hypothetical protein C8J45_101526 [Sphingomonas sp. PP-CE-3G-477]|uniref:hypothetical protein n=1 Tax=Sphingomonas sp. PP-CE-3G-477 TaxID=2135660 RepID=UPI000D332578|nr:hypothetical protein [Sphingomonas sp. PP-CE-3G-477]PTQ65674.1 hypothetical protein C8J45_101526 [Sphingomonas sp. PP-CE-3G-477]